MTNLCSSFRFCAHRCANVAIALNSSPFYFQFHLNIQPENTITWRALPLIKSWHNIGVPYLCKLLHNSVSSSLIHKVLPEYARNMILCWNFELKPPVTLSRLSISVLVSRMPHICVLQVYQATVRCLGRVQRQLRHA